MFIKCEVRIYPLSNITMSFLKISCIQSFSGCRSQSKLPTNCVNLGPNKHKNLYVKGVIDCLILYKKKINLTLLYKIWVYSSNVCFCSLSNFNNPREEEQRRMTSPVYIFQLKKSCTLMANMVTSVMIPSVYASIYLYI